MKKIILSIMSVLTLLPALALAGMSEDDNKNSKRMAAIVNTALKDSSAIVIYPCFVGGMAQNLTWGKVGTSKEFVMQGGCSNEKSEITGLYVYSYFIVEPGQYYLKNASLEFTHVDHRDYKTQAKVNPKSSLGYMNVKNFTYNERVVAMEGVNDYGTRTVFYKNQSADGVFVQSVFDAKNSPLKFTVAALEMTIIDGIKLKENDPHPKYFTEEDQTFHWDTTACSQADANAYQCPLTSYLFLVAADGKAFLSNVQKYLKKIGWTEKMLANVHYRPLENTMTQIKSFGSDGWALYESKKP